MSGAEIYQACGEGGDWVDVSPQVAPVIETELGGKFSGDGWRDWERTKPA